MTPQEFIIKWQRANLSERSAAQQHFLDLCELLGQEKPAAADPEGTHYTFERGVEKNSGGDGWADVWKKGHFGWEYKGKHKDLKAAYQQLLKYRESLENPPLLIVCDLDRFEVHTNFTGSIKKVYAFDLDGLANPENLKILRAAFTDPESLKPAQTREAITSQAAERIGQIADSIWSRNIPADRAAHFLMKLMFCMFAEDIELLGNKLFSRILSSCKNDPARLSKQLESLFSAMSSGGDFGADAILYFNGGLFADAEVIELTIAEIQHLTDANIHNWSEVEPSIFGTLFERTLDPTKRSQIGAHYTSREDIETLLRSVVMTPLLREWDQVREQCEKLWPKIQEEARKQANVKNPKRKASKPRAALDKLLTDFVDRLAHVRILDPACGSGNFLYVAVHLLLDLEKEVLAFGSAHDVTLFPQVRPSQLSGIEINPYAHELAQVVIWIGYLQWKYHNGFPIPRNPVLDPIDSIQCMDSILDLTDPNHPSEPEWPESDFIVGNPPFLGGKLLRDRLGDKYVDQMFQVWKGRVPHEADLCCYWFEKGRSQIERKKCQRAGLLATQGIRGGANREVLKQIKDTGDIFFAESDRAWVLDGANVHVSMIGFDSGTETRLILNGRITGQINPDLTGHSDVSKAVKIRANVGLSQQGDNKVGPFDIEVPTALDMIAIPNASGRPNSDVIRPWTNAAQITQRTEEKWIVDFPPEMLLEEAATFEAPFEFIKKYVFPIRSKNRRSTRADKWWIHGDPQKTMRKSLSKIGRTICTPRVSKHRVFVWIGSEVLPDCATFVFSLSDDYVFGVLHSRLHEVWSLKLGTRLETRPRYTPSSCFETFVFPEPSAEGHVSIVDAAKQLNQLRNNWLNPPEWTREEILEFSGSQNGPWNRYLHNVNEQGIGTVRYPRVVPKSDESAQKLAKRTLTNLYNERPTWLDLAHKKLDEAVFAAYGWSPDLSEEEILKNLLELNLERASAEE